MRKKYNLLQKSIITTCIYVFIIFYLLYLVYNCVIRREYQLTNTYLLLFGFFILLIGLFLSFNLDRSKQIFNFWFLSENSIKIILVIFMTISLLIIPPITFSSTIVAWQEIPFSNLFRAIIFILGSAFLPGACVFNIFFRKNTLSERFKVESFLIKLTLYPLLSFTILGISVLILDQIGLNKELISLILYTIIIILLCLDLIAQRIRKKRIIKIIVKLNLSKNTFVILLVAFGIILFSLGIMSNVGYLIPGDSWGGVSHANYIGLPEPSLSTSWLASWKYPLFWSYPTFALGVLSGLPYININVLLTPFLYLFVLTVYLFMKAILYKFKEIYAILSTVFTITFSGLLNINNISDISENGNISALIFDGLLNFRYKSFSFMLFFAGLALFFIIANVNEKGEKKKESKTENYKILVLGALFLIISYMTYMFPLLFGMIILIIYCLLIKSQNKYLILKKFSQFILFIILFFILFDLLMNFFLSKIGVNKFQGFFHIEIIANAINTFPAFFLSYLSLFILFFFSIILYLLHYILYKKKKRKLFFKNKQNFKLIVIFLIFFLFLFTILLIIYINSVIDNVLFLDINDNSLLFYLNNYFFPSIGVIGISGILLSYFCYKKNENFFLILIVWIILIFFISSFLFLKVSLSYFPQIPSLRNIIKDLTNAEVHNMLYWFTRTWYYTIPAFSILLTMGLIEITKKLKNFKVSKNRYLLGKFTKNIFISIFIFLSLTNLVVAGVYWQNSEWNVKDEEAQTIGWITNNIPKDSNILMAADFDLHLTRTLNYGIYKLMYSVKDAYEDYFGSSNWWWYISYSYDPDCNISLINEFKGHDNVLKLEDQNNIGHAKVNFNFNYPQKYGTIEYYVYSSNNSNRFWGEVSDRGIDGINLWNGSFSYYNGIKYIQLQPYIENAWYHIILDFECTTGGYKGLNQYKWRITINNTEYDNLEMYLNNSQMKSLGFNTAVKDFGWQVYLDIINFSWYPDFQVNNFIFNITYMKEYLEKNNINYYIHTSQDTWYKRNVDRDNLNIEDLINCYFTVKKYEYGDFIVYAKEI